MALVALFALPQSAQAADITGTWHLPSGDVADQTWEITAGTGAIAGEGHGGGYTWPMEGNVSGNSVQIKTAYRETSYTAYFVGTVSPDGTTMSGTWDTTSYATAESSSLTWHADRVGSGGGGPPPGGGSGKRPTATSVVCNYSFQFERHTCFAQVADTGPSPPVVPTGTMYFASTEGGSFPLGTSCAVASSQTAPTIPSCSAEYIAPGGGKFAQVVAAYSGDDQHDPSQGATAYMSAAFPTGCDIFDGCAGTNVEIKRALDLVKSLGPIEIGCGGSSASSSRRLVAAPAAFSLDLPPLTSCSAGFNGLGNILRDIQVKIGEGLSGFQFKDLLNDLGPLLSGNAPTTGGGGFGGALHRVTQGVLGPGGGGLGSVLNQVSQNVLNSPVFQSGVLESLFKSQFNQLPPLFPTPVQGQDSKRRKKNAFVIARGKFTVKSGATRKVRLKLTKRARKFFRVLRRHGVGVEFGMTLQATLVRGGVPGVAAGKTKVRVRIRR